MYSLSQDDLLWSFDRIYSFMHHGEQVLRSFMPVDVAYHVKAHLLTLDMQVSFEGEEQLLAIVQDVVKGSCLEQLHMIVRHKGTIQDRTFAQAVTKLACKKFAGG
jgi:hypothetical protein